MALIQCPECGEMISDKSERCPSCGTGIEKTLNEEKVSEIDSTCIEDNAEQTVDAEDTTTDCVESEEHVNVAKNNQVQSIDSDNSENGNDKNNNPIPKDSKNNNHIKIIVTITACIIVVILVIKFAFFNDNSSNSITSETSSNTIKNENVSNVSITDTSEEYIIGKWELAGISTEENDVVTPLQMTAAGYPVDGEMIVDSESFSLTIGGIAGVYENGDWEIYEKGDDYIAYILADTLGYVAVINYLDSTDKIFLTPMLGEENDVTVFIFEKVDE